MPCHHEFGRRADVDCTSHITHQANAYEIRCVNTFSICESLLGATRGGGWGRCAKCRRWQFQRLNPIEKCAAEIWIKNCKKAKCVYHHHHHHRKRQKNYANVAHAGYITQLEIRAFSCGFCHLLRLYGFAGCDQMRSTSCVCVDIVRLFPQCRHDLGWRQKHDAFVRDNEFDISFYTGDKYLLCVFNAIFIISP